jgi:NADH-quinone oxidoreductase subunit M
MLVAILGLAYLHSEATGRYSFDYALAPAMQIAPTTQYWFFLAFAVAFAIKVPLFPVPHLAAGRARRSAHGGLGDPGGRTAEDGHLRPDSLRVPAVPEAAAFFAPYIAVLAVIGIVYGALVAMVQPDMKKLVAYSSVSHLGSWCSASVR